MPFRYQKKTSHFIIMTRKIDKLLIVFSGGKFFVSKVKKRNLWLMERKDAAFRTLSKSRLMSMRILREFE